MQTPILQFGTSRFLQAHALNYLASGTPDGAVPAVTVVQSTSDPARRARLDALAAPEGYPVRVRGIEDGVAVEREERVAIVKRGLGYDRDLAEIERIFIHEARWVISNTADSGYDPQPADMLPHADPGQSWPAKLFHLLKARHLAGKGPLTILPTELIPRNGEVLHARVREIAIANGADAGLLGAIDANLWVCSLVDRIVSDEIRPAGAVAEPYGIWAIEDQPGLVMPARHPAIRIVPALEPYERLKLHILNLGHTVLVHLWRAGGETEAFVREALAGPMRAELVAIIEDEVLPGFAARGLGAEARDYLHVTLERFENPFLDHRLSDIAQNHAQKVERRLKGFAQWSGQGPDAAPRLHAIIAA